MKTNTIIVHYINKTTDIFHEAYICNPIYNDNKLAYEFVYPEFIAVAHKCDTYNPLSGEHVKYEKRTMINKRQIKKIDIVEEEIDDDNND